MEDWSLDRGGEGCFLTHAQLGERLNLTENAVQIHRSWMAKRGLYERIKRPGDRTPGWRPVVPVHCRMQSQRPTPEQVSKARTFLDLHLQAVPGTGPGRAGEGSNPSRGRGQPVPQKVSQILSTAFDSQPLTNPSTALSFEGSKAYGNAPESKAIQGGDLPQSVLPSKPGLSSESESETQFQPRPIDERPRQQVEDEGWEKLRRAHAERKKQAGGR